MNDTRRQQILEALEHRAWAFEDLRQHLELPVKLLADDLRHVEKTLKHDRRRLVVREAECARCGFVFRGRSRKHLHPPGRCPECKSELIDGPWLEVE